MFKGQKQHNDDEVKRAQEFIEKNIEEKITGITPVEYRNRYNKITIQKNKELSFSKTGE